MKLLSVFFGSSCSVSGEHIYCMEIQYLEFAMEFPPEVKSTIYFVMHFNRLGKWVKSRHRLSAEEAARQFVGQKYELVEAGKMEITLSGDPNRNSTSAFRR